MKRIKLIFLGFLFLLSACKLNNNNDLSHYMDNNIDIILHSIKDNMKHNFDKGLEISPLNVIDYSSVMMYEPFNSSILLRNSLKNAKTHSIKNPNAQNNINGIFEVKNWADNQGDFWDKQIYLAGDFNGDSKTDIAKVFGEHKGIVAIDVHLSDGQRFYDWGRWERNGNLKFDYNGQKWVVGDFNGDNKDDLAVVYNSGGAASAKVYLSNGSKFVWKHWATKQGGFWNDQKWFVGDFDNNGFDDLGKAFKDGYNKNELSIDVHLSNGQSFYTWQRWTTGLGNFNKNQRWFTGDFAGSINIQLAKAYGAKDNYISIDVIRSQTSRKGNPISFNEFENWGVKDQGYFGTNQIWFVGDFNNDGFTDLGKLFPDIGNKNKIAIDIHLSELNRFKFKRWSSDHQKVFSYKDKWVAGDFNGDQKSDLAKVYNKNGRVSIEVYENKSY